MPPKPKDDGPKQFRVLVGLSYPDPKKPGSEKQAEEGEVVSDLPPKSVEWLLAQNLIQEV